MRRRRLVALVSVALVVAIGLSLWLPFRMDVSVERRVRCHSK